LSEEKNFFDVPQRKMKVMVMEREEVAMMVMAMVHEEKKEMMMEEEEVMMKEEDERVWKLTRPQTRSLLLAGGVI
jgi:hypothetical protein